MNLSRPPDSVQSNPLGLVVLISGSGSTLANLIDCIADGRLASVRIDAVISSRAGVAGIAIAERAGIPVTVCPPKDYGDSTAWSAALTAAIDAVAPDLVVMAGFLARWDLPPRYQRRTLNIHPALLPDFGGPGMYGRHVHEAVLASGATVSGCTVHLVDEIYDHGPIVAQARVPVLPDDTPASLARGCRRRSGALYPRVLRQIVSEGTGWLERAHETLK